ncbi:hypothetical protein EVAR_39328_1 [Eumeta japonica]|uniref:Uncharacterized protein n=1 Tax=Eumeta variegata TaxID=151549 RepID=A0A4C1WPK7_EUMVA|nr:hypothetical protein EVAR_39328_1 [Eumeta japonica]
MIEKLPQSRYTRDNVQVGRDNLETKDGLAPLLSCRRPDLENYPCLPIHITIKVAIKGHPYFYTVDCPCGRYTRPSQKKTTICEAARTFLFLSIRASIDISHQRLHAIYMLRLNRPLVYGDLQRMCETLKTVMKRTKAHPWKLRSTPHSPQRTRHRHFDVETQPPALASVAKRRRGYLYYDPRMPLAMRAALAAGAETIENNRTIKKTLRN